MRRALTWLGVAALTVALLEVGALVLARAGWLETPAPNYGAVGFWQGHHPDFGVWHAPDAAIRHRRACFDVGYRTNSVGARDVERPRTAEGPRVVVLGDSFLEGWGVEAPARLSNRLEAATGLPHLNFAMSHFGPYQQVVLYEKLASGFDHDAVIASVAPVNDFRDLAFERARAMARYEYRYRPYLVGDPPDFAHFDFRESWLRRWLRGYSYAGNALIAAAESLASDPEPEVDDGASGRRPRSLFYDFSEREIALLEAALGRLAAATAGKPTAVLLIPSQRDLDRRAISGPDPLSARLAPVAKRHGLVLVDLLPAMADYTLEWRSYFLPCDFHWSARGNAVASDITRRALADALYGPLGAPVADATRP